jgi:hypothetical protein
LNDIIPQIETARAAGKEIHVYAPSRQMIGTLEFDPIKLKAAFEDGYAAKELTAPIV